MHWSLENLTPIGVASESFITRKSKDAKHSSLGIAAVLKSLVPAQKAILRYIVKAQKDGSPHTFETLLTKCKNTMTVSGGAQHLRNMVAELTDHEIVKFSEGVYLLRVTMEDAEKALAAS